MERIRPIETQPDPQECPIPYEAPSLTPIGSLHDLLAGGGTQPRCDMGTFDTNGGNSPVVTPPFGC